MTDVPSSDVPQGHYDGWRGALRIIVEVFAEMPGMAKESLDRTWSVINGEATIEGETCQMEGCDRSKAGQIPSTDDWRDPWDACRFHWLVFYAITKGIWIVLWLAAVILLVWMVVP